MILRIVSSIAIIAVAALIMNTGDNKYIYEMTAEEYQSNDRKTIVVVTVAMVLLAVVWVFV